MCLLLYTSFSRRYLFSYRELLSTTAELRALSVYVTIGVTEEGIIIIISYLLPLISSAYFSASASIHSSQLC